MDPTMEAPASEQLLPDKKPNYSEGMKGVICFFSWDKKKTRSKTPDKVGSTATG